MEDSGEVCKHNNNESTDVLMPRWERKKLVMGDTSKY